MLLSALLFVALVAASYANKMLRRESLESDGSDRFIPFPETYNTSGRVATVVEWTVVNEWAGGSYVMRSDAYGTLEGGADGKLSDDEINHLMARYQINGHNIFKITSTDTERKSLFIATHDQTYQDTARNFGFMSWDRTFQRVAEDEGDVVGLTDYTPLYAPSMPIFDSSGYGQSEACSRFFMGHNKESDCYDPRGTPGNRCFSGGANCGSGYAPLKGIKMYLRTVDDLVRGFEDPKQRKRCLDSWVVDFDRRQNVTSLQQCMGLCRSSRESCQAISFGRADGPYTLKCVLCGTKTDSESDVWDLYVKESEEPLPVLWTGLNNVALATPSNEGKIVSTEGDLHTSYAVSSVEIKNTTSNLIGIGFKFTNGEGMAVVGLRCDESSGAEIIDSASSCYFMIGKNSSGAFIKERGSNLYRPETVSLKAPWTPNWATDVWQLRVTADGYIEYIRNDEVFYTGKSKPERFPLNVYAAFSSGEGLDSAYFVRGFSGRGRKSACVHLGGRYKSSFNESVIYSITQKDCSVVVTAAATNQTYRGMVRGDSIELVGPDATSVGIVGSVLANGSMTFPDSELGVLSKIVLEPPSSTRAEELNNSTRVIYLKVAINGIDARKVESKSILSDLLKQVIKSELQTLLYIQNQSLLAISFTEDDVFNAFAVITLESMGEAVRSSLRYHLANVVAAGIEGDFAIKLMQTVKGVPGIEEGMRTGRSVHTLQLKGLEQGALDDVADLEWSKRLLDNQARSIPFYATTMARFEVLQNTMCSGGPSIMVWDSGQLSAYGSGLTNKTLCGLTCSAHTECAGFVVDRGTKRCTLWLAFPVQNFSLAGFECHIKQVPVTKAKSEATRFSDFDLDGDGQISYDEFVRAKATTQLVDDVNATAMR